MGFARRSTRSTRSFQSRQAGRTNWARITDVNVSVAAGTKVLVAVLALSNPGINETIRRTRGRFIFTSDQAGTYEGTVAAFGWVVVNDLALAAGAASIPGPITDASDDGWLVWEGYPALFGSTNTGSSTNNSAQFRPTEFDSKAMRKVPEGFGVALMAEVTLFGVEFSHATSVLTSRQ